MALRVLVIDSNLERHAVLTAMFSGPGYHVDCVPHEEAIGRISAPSFEDYGAIVLQVAAQPSRASMAFRTGDYVLHYLTQLRPESLARVVVLCDGTSEPIDRSAIGGVVQWPAAPEDLFAAIVGVTR